MLIQQIPMVQLGPPHQQNELTYGICSSFNYITWHSWTEGQLHRSIENKKEEHRQTLHGAVKLEINTVMFRISTMRNMIQVAKGTKNLQLKPYCSEISSVLNCTVRNLPAHFKSPTLIYQFEHLLQWSGTPYKTWK